MTRLLDIRHSAPAVVVARGSRVEREAYVLQVTPGRLTEVDPSEMAFEAWLPDHWRKGGGETPLYRHDGGLWTMLADDRLGKGEMLSFFEHFLEDHGQWSPVFHAGHFLVRTFGGTPILPAEPFRNGAEFTRGSFLDPASLRHVEVDPAQASAHLLDHLARNVRVAGGEVYVRMLGPVAKHVTDNAYAVLPDPRPVLLGKYEHAVRPDLIDRAWLHRKGRKSLGSTKALDRSGMAAATLMTAPSAASELLGDADLAIAACAAPAAVRAMAWGPRVRRQAEPEMDRLLLRDIARAGVGAIPAAEAEAVLSRCVAYARGITGLNPAGAQAAYVSYISDVLLPRFSPDPSPEDEEALGAVAPGP